MKENLKEVNLEDSIEKLAPNEPVLGLSRSSRVRNPIKRLLNEQTLFNETSGPIRGRKCYKCSKDIIQEGFNQRVNVGHYDRKPSGSKTKKSRISSQNTMSLNILKWENTVHAMKQSSSGIRQFVEVNYDEDTIEDMRPDCLNAKFKKHDPDLPTFSQAMNGEESEEYWEACQKEYDTLQNKIEAWNIVNRDASMNVLPGTLVLRKKLRPDGSVSKYKSRFCVRNDKQIDQVDFDSDQLYSPVYCQSTIRLMLVLSIVLNLAIVQVD